MTPLTLSTIYVVVVSVILSVGSVWASRRSRARVLKDIGGSQ